MGAILIGFFYLLGVTWLAVAFLIFFSLAILILFFAGNAPVGACPFCGGLIQRYNRLRAEPVRCEQCGEISKFENERFSPYDPSAVSTTPIFRSSLYEDAIWPNGCVQCGATPTRFDITQAVRYQARRLATPLASSLYRRAKSAVSTGYREPNLLQKTVSEVFAKPETRGPGGAAPHTNPSKPGV
jgi:hypothetical protein